MRGNENYVRREVKSKVKVADGAQIIKTRKFTNKAVSLNQRLVLEAVRSLREASVSEIALEIEKTRDSTKNVVRALFKQGYLEQSRKEVRIGAGCLPAAYKWSGKTFPPSSELARAAAVPESVAFARIVVPSSPEVAVLVAGINAMVCAGRAAA
jgi:hypothetical protein